MQIFRTPSEPCIIRPTTNIVVNVVVVVGVAVGMKHYKNISHRRK